MRSPHVWCAIVLAGSINLALDSGIRAADLRVLPEGQLPADARLGAPRTLNDAYHPWQPPTTKVEWERTAERLRAQVLVSTGLWPMWPREPLQPVVHSKLERDDYTVEKVYFASLPGLYVTGNLYRPKNRMGGFPGVLCPHGHWPNGRFYDAGDKGAEEQLQQGAERFGPGAHSPLQARMVGLARLGCVVFHYDMIGYADQKPLEHRSGFNDVAAELRLQNILGLQTFNSIRALDFLVSLPDVDPQRIGVTGASGGGTQTFMLCAVDPRPTVAFPAVMVSTGMQGGCGCENASYLRIGINNIALAALFAPKPLAMSGADDWTIDIETKGLPELQQVYGLYGAKDLVQAKCYPQFKHNYNQVAREMMYAWFARHLQLDPAAPVAEREFPRLSAAELSVFDEAHPVPAEAAKADALRARLSALSDAQVQALLPVSPGQTEAYRKTFLTAARVMLDTGIPGREELDASPRTETRLDGIETWKLTLGRRGAQEQIPVLVFIPANFSGTSVVWVDGRGKQGVLDDAGKPVAAVRKLLDTGRSVVAPDLFLTGEFLKPGAVAEFKVNGGFPGYTYAYNRPLLSQRVRDILTVLGAVAAHPDVSAVELVATGNAGVWGALAAGLTEGRLRRTVVDLQGFGFGKVTQLDDPNLLPGGLKYLGIGGLVGLAAPQSLVVAGTDGVPAAELQVLEQVYRNTAADRLVTLPGTLSLDAAAAQLLDHP